MTAELRLADAGSRRTVRLGDLTTVRLPESPTTGYRWQADHDDAALRLVEDRFEGAQSPRGAGGDRVLIFEAARLGSATLRLAKRRGWGGGEPIDEFSAELDVQPSD